MLFLAIYKLKTVDKKPLNMTRIVELDEYKIVMIAFPKWEELIKETIKDIMAGLLKESHNKEMIGEVSNDYSKLFDEANS